MILEYIHEGLVGVGNLTLDLEEFGNVLILDIHPRQQVAHECHLVLVRMMLLEICGEDFIELGVVWFQNILLVPGVESLAEGGSFVESQIRGLGRNLFPSQRLRSCIILCRFAVLNHSAFDVGLGNIEYLVVERLLLLVSHRSQRVERLQNAELVVLLQLVDFHVRCVGCVNVSFLAPAYRQQCLLLRRDEWQNALSNRNLHAVVVLLEQGREQGIEQHRFRLRDPTNRYVVIAKALKEQDRVLDGLLDGLVGNVLDDEIDEVEGAHFPVHDHLIEMPPDASSLVEIVNFAEIVEECLERLVIISDFAVSVVTRVEEQAADGVAGLDWHGRQLLLIADYDVLDLMLGPRAGLVEHYVQLMLPDPVVSSEATGLPDGQRLD